MSKINIIPEPELSRDYILTEENLFIILYSNDKIDLIFTQNSTNPINKRSEDDIKKEMYISELDLHIKEGDIYLGKNNIRDKILQKSADQYTADVEHSDRDKNICFFMLKDIVHNNYASRYYPEPEKLKDIALKLINNDISGIQDLIDNNMYYQKDDKMHYQKEKPFLINTILKLPDGLNDKSLLKYIAKRELSKIKNNNSYINMSAMNALKWKDENLIFEMVCLNKEIDEIETNNLFTIRNKYNHLELIAGDNFITRAMEYDEDKKGTIKMDGKPFTFNGIEYPASIEGLKFLTMVNYGDDYKITDNLTTKPEAKNEVDLKQKHKNKM